MLIQGNALAIPLKDKSVQCVVTSPPYWGLRDYGVAFQLGLEKTPEEYLANMVAVFAEVWRVLRDDGTAWVNMGDCYVAGTTRGRRTSTNHNKNHGYWENDQIDRRVDVDDLAPKNLVGMPWRLAFALQAAGWYLRRDIIWAKPNPMPESCSDRPTTAHEYVFLLSKRARYFFDQDAVREPYAPTSLARWNQDIDNQEGSWRVQGKTNGSMKAVGGPRSHKGSHLHTGKTGATQRRCSEVERVDDPNGRNIRSVWTVPTQGFSEAHFATYPEALVKPCILAGCPVGGIVLDPFVGSGTTVKVAQDLGRVGVGLELKADYLAQARRRTAQTGLRLPSTVRTERSGGTDGTIGTGA